MQRVSSARVEIDGEVAGSIGRGLLVLLGVGQGDSEKQALWLADKIAGLRIFEDDAGKMNLSVEEVAGSALVVSQFTLYADCRKGRRPSFQDCAPGIISQPLYEQFLSAIRLLGITPKEGVFGAHMRVLLENDGPVTFMIEE